LQSQWVFLVGDWGPNWDGDRKRFFPCSGEWGKDGDGAA